MDNPKMKVSQGSLERLFNLLDIVEIKEVSPKVRGIVENLGDCFPEGNEAEEEGISYEQMLAIVGMAGCSRDEALQFRDIVKEAGGLDSNQASFLIRKLGRVKG